MKVGFSVGASPLHPLVYRRKLKLKAKSEGDSSQFSFER